MYCLYLCLDLFGRFDEYRCSCEKSFKIRIVTEIDGPEVTLCGWQDIEIILLTLSLSVSPPLLSLSLSPPSLSFSLSQSLSLSHSLSLTLSLSLSLSLSLFLWFDDVCEE